MHIFKFMNPRRHAQLLWPSISAVIASLACSPAPAQTNQAPTYLRDIQPIFMGSCSRCHNQQSQFVYDWLDYKTAYADRWEIRRRIWDSWKGTYFKEAMPVANSPESMALTEAERLTIRKWVDDGGFRGVPPPLG